MTLLTRQDLDRMMIEGCDACKREGTECQSHEGVFLHGKCHPDAGAWVEYKDGRVRLLCGSCGFEIVQVKVALE
jgi:hypothetical protein